MSAPKTWRDLIKVHPAADLFPMMSDAELDEMAADIDANGIRQNLVLWTPEKYEEVRPRKGPQEVYLLDGRNRLEALQRSLANDPSCTDEERESEIRDALHFDPGHPNSRNITFLYGETDPYEYAISLNLRRRHLTGEQKREIIAKLLKAQPERSNRETAKLAQADHKTVGAVRANLQETGEIPQLEKTVGADGKARSTIRVGPAPPFDWRNDPTISLAWRNDPEIVRQAGILIDKFHALLAVTPRAWLPGIITKLRESLERDNRVQR